jgi:hypothetical protein
MPFLSSAQILEAADRRHQDVDVPEWGGQVRVAVFSGTERERFERETTGEDGKVLPGFRELLLVRTLINENNERLFSDGDIASLGCKSGAVIARLFDVAMRVNGFSKEASEAAKGN